MNDQKLYDAVGNVRFFGRTANISSCEAIYFNWSGSGFVFRFRGTSAGCVLLGGVNGEEPPEKSSRGYVGVYIDGVPCEVARFVLDKPRGMYTLAEGLPYGEHTVYVVKETEAAYGRAAVTQISTDGEILPPPAAPELKIEFIGDSITCGYGNICSTASPEFVTSEENFSQTYAAVASRILGAQPSVVAASGNGFFHDYGCNTHNLIPELYEYTDKFLHEHCGEMPQKWSFGSDKQDIVVIKLGQNDAQFCCGADLPQEERSKSLLAARRADFSRVASEFLIRIKVLRPETPILVIYETDMYLKNELTEAVKKANCGIHTLEFLPKREYEGVGANGHYSVCTHARVGALVASKIKEILC